MKNTRKEFQRLQKQKYNMLRRDWNKYSDKANQAYIQKKAKEFDVNIPKNIKAFKKYANRIANKMEERQYLYTQDNQEVIDQLNNIKKQLSDTDKYNKFSKNNKKITPLSQVYNFIKNRFGHIKGDITMDKFAFDWFQKQLAKRKESKKLKNASTKELKKYRKNSVSQITKFKTRGGISGWDAAYGLLNGSN